MRLSHSPARTRATFDDPNLVSRAGLVSVMALAERCGLSALVRQTVTIISPPGVNAQLKVGCLVAGMAAGADSIDDMDVLRHGAMGTLFDGIRAPSTLGSFLRSFTWGNVRQLEAAGDVARLDRVHWVMLTSMLKTLACKYDSSVSKMAAKYMTTIETPCGPRRCFQASVERQGRKPLVARFGGIPLKRHKTAVIDDRKPVPATFPRKELIDRLLTGRCEMCQQPDGIEVHHVRKLASLTKPGRPQSAWAELMARKRRKTLVVCADCHKQIHARQPTATPTE